MKIIVALCVIALTTGCQPRTRYEIITTQGKVIRLNTETGQTWQLGVDTEGQAIWGNIADPTRL